MTGSVQCNKAEVKKVCAREIKRVEKEGFGILRRDTHLNTILTLTLTPILFMPR